MRSNVTSVLKTASSSKSLSLSSACIPLAAFASDLVRLCFTATLTVCTTAPRPFSVGADMSSRACKLDGGMGLCCNWDNRWARSLRDSLRALLLLLPGGSTIFASSMGERSPRFGEVEIRRAGRTDWDKLRARFPLVVGVSKSPWGRRLSRLASETLVSIRNTGVAIRSTSMTLQGQQAHEGCY